MNGIRYLKVVNKSTFHLVNILNGCWSNIVDFDRLNQSIDHFTHIILKAISKCYICVDIFEAKLINKFAVKSKLSHPQSVAVYCLAFDANKTLQICSAQTRDKILSLSHSFSFGSIDLIKSFRQKQKKKKLTFVRL